MEIRREFFIGTCNLTGKARRNRIFAELRMQNFETEKPSFSLVIYARNQNDSGLVASWPGNSDFLKELLPKSWLGESSGSCRFETPGVSLLKELGRLGRLYHLNDMHAGTEKQEDFLEEYFKAHPDLPRTWENACQVLKDADLLDDGGYVYGTAWLYRKIPAEDMLRILTLICGPGKVPARYLP